jgi:hypothetical protein
MKRFPGNSLMTRNRSFGRCKVAGEFFGMSLVQVAFDCRPGRSLDENVLTSDPQVTVYVVDPEDGACRGQFSWPVDATADTGDVLRTVLARFKLDADEQLALFGLIVEKI